MKRIMVIGCGLIGPAVALDLVQSQEISEVAVGDIDDKKIEQLLKRVKSGKLTGQHVDISDQEATKRQIRDFDVVISALPYITNILASKAAAEAGVHLVDCTYANEQWGLDATAKKTGAMIIPDCGVAPGIANVLVGHAVGLMDEVDDVRIMVGGIPQKPMPPLGYKIVFSTEGVVDMCCGKAPIYRNGDVVEVDVLSGLELVDFPGVGKLEAFYTDGLSTLLRTMKGRIKNMSEKTARWPGHVEKIQAMKGVGYFDTDPIDVDGVKVIPRRMTIRLWDKYLRLGKDERDMTVLRIEVVGRKNGEKVEHTFLMVDHYDEDNELTSMARTTGYTAAIISRMVARGDIKGKGLTPIETAVEGKFDIFMSELSRKGIKIKEMKKCGHFS
jgi:lysine 6-dehydrogenase